MNFVSEESLKELKMLEINQAGVLSKFKKNMPNHTIRVFPGVDMMKIPFENETLDIVIHYDTLKYEEHPVRALSGAIKSETRHWTRPN